MDNIIGDIKKLIASGKLGEAELTLSNALENNPDLPELLYLKADLSLNRGSLFWEQGDIDRALDYLTKALEINPADRNTVLKCGEVLAELEQRDSALNLYTNYLKKHPHDEKIQRALNNLSADKTPTNYGPEKIVIAANLVPFKDQGQLERQQACIQSISDLIPAGIVPLNICYPDEFIQPSGWEVSATLSGSADKLLNIEGKRKPFVTDLFETAADWAHKSGIEWFIVTNSDIIIAPRLIDEIRSLSKEGYETVAFSRFDVVEIDQSTWTAKGYVEFTGSDVFACRASWWKENRHRFQPYIFGERAWDNAFAGIMASHSKCHISFAEELCFHLKHSLNWQFSSPYADYNMGIYTGADKIYAEKYFLFLTEIMNLPKGGRTFEKTTRLLQKHFSPQIIPSQKRKPAVKGKTSIILLVSDGGDRVGRCIQRIREHTPEPHEIILVPVGVSPISDEKFLPLMGNHEGYQLLKDTGSLTYPQACNKGILESSGEFLIILKDDVMVTDGWLSGMLEHLHSAPDIGIVGPMTVNVDGPQGVHGVESGEWKVVSEKKAKTHGATSRLFETTDQIEQFAKTFRERNRYRRAEAVNLSGFCMLFRADLVNKIGLFDEQLDFYDFADNDFCLRSAMEGHRNIIAGDVFVCTQKNRTLGGIGPESGASITKSAKIFHAKWNSLDTGSLQGKNYAILAALSAAQELAQKGQRDSAALALLEGLKTAPDAGRLHYALAELLIGEKNFSDTLAILDRMPEPVKQDAKWLELLGYCKEGLSLNEEAGQHADEMLMQNSVSPKALNLKGLLAYKKGLLDIAKGFYQGAMENDRGWGEPYTNMGALLWNAGEREEALTFLEKAFILSPTHEEIVLNYHSAAVSLSKLEEAENLFREASSLHPMNKRLQYTLLDILLQQEKYREAMTVLQKAILDFGADEENLGVALSIRERIGPKDIGKNKKSSLLMADSLYAGKGEGEDKGKAQGKGKVKGKKKVKTQQTQRTIQPRETQGTISLCMIVRDEEENIGKCLKEIDTVADEIIVVDTGSSDRTKDIARAFGAKVYDFAWNSDFSAARNYSLSKATGNWILILDADEVISPKDHNRLRELLSPSSFILHPSSPPAYSFTTRNYVYPVQIGWTANDGSYFREEAGTGWIPSDKARLFPNHPDIRFESPVHELVEPSLKRLGIEILKCPVPVHHYGKLDTERQKSKNDGYYSLGKQKLSEKGEPDSKAVYELAVQATMNHRHEEALELWEMVIRADYNLRNAYSGLGNVYFSLRRYGEAISALEKARRLDPDAPDITSLLAKCKIYDGYAEQAVPLLRGLLEKNPGYPSALGLLAIACFCTGSREEGLKHIAKLGETYFDSSVLLSEHARKLMQDRKHDYALSILEAAIEGNCVTHETHKLLEEAREKIQGPRGQGVEESEEKGPRGQGFKDSSDLDPRILESSNPASLSLCMIVKDEEENIGRSLTSVKGLVDEMVVVDTGSRDKTKKIARSFAAKVFDFEWTDDFSEARNYSLSKATGDWILILDADEVISPRDHDRLRALIKGPRIQGFKDSEEKGPRGQGVKESSDLDPRILESSDPASAAYSFTTRNYVNAANTIKWNPNDGRYAEEGGTGWFPGEKVRLFPNRQGLRFEYPVHERIEPSLIQSGIRIEDCDVPIHHYGKLDPAKAQEKAERYYGYAKRKFAEQQDKDYTAGYELAVQAAEIGRHEEALGYLKEVIAARSDFAGAHLSMGNNYFNLARYGDALESYEKAFGLDPGLKDAIIQASLCRLYTGNPEPAIAQLEEIVQKEQENTRALALLAVLYFIADRKSEGLRCMEQLKQVNFDSAGFLLPLVKILLSREQPDYAIKLLEAATDAGIAPEKGDIFLSAAHMTKKLAEHNTKVSLIILASDNQAQTEACVSAVRRHTPEPHEVVIVQRESSPSPLSPPGSRQTGPPLKGGEDRSRALPRGMDNARNATSSSPSLSDSIGQSSEKEWFPRSNRETTAIQADPPKDKLTFARAVNKGIRESSGDYLVVLTDDIVVTDGWLSGMLECFTEKPDTGIVGPVVSGPGGQQGVHRIENGDLSVESGEKAEIPGDSSMLFETAGQLEPYAGNFRRKNRFRRIPRKKLESACLLTSRPVLSHIGFFNEDFISDEFTIQDFCLRILMEKMKVLIAGDVLVHMRRPAYDRVLLRERMLAENKTLFADKKPLLDRWSNTRPEGREGMKIIAINSLHMADEFSQAGKQDKAAAALLEGIQYCPDDQDLHSALAELLIENKNFREASDLIAKFPEDLKQAAATFELLASCKAGMNLHHEAEEYADKALALNGSSPRAWNLKGLAAYGSGDVDGAEECFQKALSLDKSFGEPHANLGALLWAAGRREEALDAFERAVILSPAHGDIVFNYHTVATTLSQLERAEQTLKDAVSVYPSNRRLKLVLSDILLQRGDYDSAMRLLEEIAATFGTDKDILALALGVREKIGPKDILKDKGARIQGFEDSKEKGPRAQGAKESSDLDPRPLESSAPAVLDPRTLESSTTVSLCMIVRNEEKNIGKCLHSIAPLVDEMIVVDTGSVDMTKDIAQAFGAKVYDFPWTGDFSEARNFSLAQASGDWILVLDADEIITGFDQELMKALISRPDCRSSAFSIISRNYVIPVTAVGWTANDGSYINEEVGTGWYPSEKVRVFPNHPEIRFQNPVHEFVEESLARLGIPIVRIDTPVHHYGKLDREKTLKKGEEYYILGKAKLAQRGEQDFIALYELAVQASELERYDEALEHWKKVSEMNPSFAKAHFGIGNCHYRFGRFEEALQATEKAIKLERADSNEKKEMVNLYASSAVCIGRAELCIPFLQEILRREPDYPMAMAMLTIAYFCTDQKKKGLKYLRKLKDMHYNFERHFFDFAQFLTGSRNPRYARSLIDAVIESGTADGRFFMLRDECTRILKEETAN